MIPNGVGMWSAVACLGVPLSCWIVQALRQAWARRHLRATHGVHILGSSAAHPLQDVAPRPQRSAAEWDHLIGTDEGEEKS